MEYKKIGKLEALKHGKPELYSSRIDKANRLIYSIDKVQNIKIISYRSHHED